MIRTRRRRIRTRTGALAGLLVALAAAGTLAACGTDASGGSASGSGGARAPARSLAWCAGAAFFVAVRPGNHAVDAFGTLVFALLAVGAGLLEVIRLSSNAPEADTRHPLTPGLA